MGRRATCKRITGVVLCFLFSFPVLVRSAELVDELKKIGLDFSEVSFTDVLNSEFLGKLQNQNLSLEIAEATKLYEQNKDDNGYKGRLDLLKTLSKSARLEFQYQDHYTNFVLHSFKPEHGGYNRLGVSTALEFKEGELVEFQGKKARFCGRQVESLLGSLGAPNVARDLIPENFQVFGLFDGSVKAQWLLSDYAIDFSCTTALSAHNFRLNGESIKKPSSSLIADVQNALNFFGFDVGKADGVSGKKTRLGLANFQQCIRQVEIGDYLDSEIDFLLENYERLKPYRGSANCSDLLEKMPVNPLLIWARVYFLPKDQVKKINPIVWLKCVTTKQRLQLFILGGSDETETVQMTDIFGVDFADKEIFSQSKNKISEGVKISDSAINFGLAFSTSEEFFDQFSEDFTIDRITGDFKREKFGTKQGKLNAKLNGTGSCELIDLNKKKF